MKIVIPVSSHDRCLVEAFCNVVNFFGPYFDHELLVVVRPSDSRIGVDVFNTISGKFSNPKIYIFEDDGIYGWPQGPNHYWKNTVQYLHHTDNRLPWLWMEMDCTPIKNRWIHKIEKEYIKMGSSCLGMIQRLWRDDDECEHLVGVAVYPHDLGTRIHSWKTIDGNSLAFDIHCRHELLPMSKSSKIIGNHFRTSNYDCTDSGMRGQVNDWEFAKYYFNKPISRDTVLVHGCNDGSLARLITNT
jgi:hypothetical protein